MLLDCHFDLDVVFNKPELQFVANHKHQVLQPVLGSPLWRIESLSAKCLWKCFIILSIIGKKTSLGIFTFLIISESMEPWSTYGTSIYHIWDCTVNYDSFTP